MDGWTGGWVGGWGKIKIKDNLSPAEAETGAELGNFSLSSAKAQVKLIHD